MILMSILVDQGENTSSPGRVLDDICVVDAFFDALNFCTLGHQTQRSQEPPHACQLSWQLLAGLIFPPIRNQEYSAEKEHPDGMLRCVGVDNPRGFLGLLVNIKHNFDHPHVDFALFYLLSPLLCCWGASGPYWTRQWRSMMQNISIVLLALH
jgi:hypothetical protein